MTLRIELYGGELHSHEGLDNVRSGDDYSGVQLNKQKFSFRNCQNVGLLFVDVISRDSCALLQQRSQEWKWNDV